MGIYIDQINLHNFGPLGNRELHFGKLNLIYGLNESGKTFLTEFILQSVFKYPSASKWQMRDIPGQGKVILSGLEAGPIEFSPKTKRKIEDYWVDTAPGLPTNMARLLFVKGGELTLTSSEKETNKHFLKSVLSQEVLFERILRKIKVTIKKADIVDGNIIGDNRGDIANRNNIREELLAIDDLLEDIENNYSSGQLYEKRQQLDNITRDLKTQENAKKHYAFTLNNMIDKIEREIIPDKDLEDLHDDLKEFKRVEGEIERVNNRYKEGKNVVDDFSWLDQAVRIWESLGLATKQKPSLRWQIAASVMFLLGLLGFAIQLVFSALEQNNGWNWLLDAFSIVFILFGIGFNVLYLIKLNKWEKVMLNTPEREAIKTGYKDRFQKSIRGLTDLRTHLESLRDKYLEFKSIPLKIDELERSNQTLYENINSEISRFNPECLKSDDWESCFQEIKQSQENNKKRLEKTRIDLARLNVDKINLLENPAKEEYDHDKLSRLVEVRGITQKEIDHLESDLENLKARACQETQDDLDADWLEVLDSLRSKRERLQKKYRRTTAKIVGEIASTKVLFNIQKGEDEKINRGLQTKELKEILKIVTSRYGAIDLSGDELLIKGGAGDYYLGEISTGTREQVLLAIRMAFASKFAGGEPLFMVLDDAFQHTDWTRREQLFDVIFKFVDAGWQMTCLTMSDQIRNRFMDLGKDRLGDEFVSYSLP